nr:hypothetical protein [Streptomyces sp. SID5910]
MDAFLRNAADGGGDAAPKEPSARARMVTERLRAQDEAAASGGRRWGRKKPAPPAQPPGWRTGPAWQEMNGGRSRRRQIKSAVGVLVAVAVAVLVVKPSLVFDGIPEEPLAAAEPQLPAETAPPTAAPGGAALPEEPTHERPFLGSPAERWAEGAGAIELPPARATGGMSKADVELGLRRTKSFLVASNIDPAVLRGARPEQALALLDPEQTDVYSLFSRALREPSEKYDPLTLFTRFDPDEVRLVGPVVKVRGHMKVEAGDDPGLFRVHADYTFVYPLAKAGEGGGHVERTIVRRQITVEFADPEHYEGTAGKLWVNSYAVDSFNDSCGVYDGYFHPEFPDTVTGDLPTGAVVDPYDRTAPVGEGTGCREVIRT